MKAWREWAADKSEHQQIQEAFKRGFRAGYSNAHWEYKGTHVQNHRDPNALYKEWRRFKEGSETYIGTDTDLYCPECLEKTNKNKSAGSTSVMNWQGIK